MYLWEQIKNAEFPHIFSLAVTELILEIISKKKTFHQEKRLAHSK